MDIMLLMMLTASALYQDVESPVGETAFFGKADSESETEMPQQLPISRTIAGEWADFEDECRQQGYAPQEIEDMYASIRQVAQRWEGGE